MNLRTLGRVKPLSTLLSEAGRGGKGELKRSLGWFSLTALGIGAIIGTGIFVLIGRGAHEAGPGIMYSFIVAGLVSALAAFCYAELASSVPIAGSAYTYCYATLGELFAWIIGWGLILEYAVGAATVSIGWSGYFADFFKSFGVVMPHSLLAGPFDADPGLMNLPAAAAILVITYLLTIGTKETTTFNNVVVSVKLVVVLFFIAVAAFHVNPVNWTPFLPSGWDGVFRGAALIFFAYIGFDAVSTSAEEARNPGRDLPIGILLSLFVCTILYIAVSGLLTGMQNYATLDLKSPVSHALLSIGLNWAAGIISVGALAGLTTVLLVMLYAQSRVFFAMSRDGMIPALFSRVHPKWNTPYLSSIIVGVTVAAVAAFTPIQRAAEITNIGTLAAFVIVAVGVAVLRSKHPTLTRLFLVPGSPWIPIISVLATLALISYLPNDTKVMYVIWQAIGLAIYFSYSNRNSALAKASNKIIVPNGAPKPESSVVLSPFIIRGMISAGSRTIR